MNWTCPHCGKRMAVTDDYLASTGGMVVCPQCLGSEQLPGYGSRPRRNAPAPPAAPASTTATAQRRATPPPYQPRQRKSAAMPATPPARTAPNQQQPADKTPPAKRKAAKRRKKSGGTLSAWGCFWRSVVFTLILLAVYVLFGLVMQLA